MMVVWIVCACVVSFSRSPSCDSQSNEKNHARVTCRFSSKRIVQRNWKSDREMNRKSSKIEKVLGIIPG